VRRRDTSPEHDRSPVTSNVVLDASAVLAAFRKERGGEQVGPLFRRALISTVNYTEILARTTELSGSFDSAKHFVDRHPYRIVPFDQELAAITTTLIPVTKPFGLSLADRACLALAIQRGVPVYTADRDWTKVSLDVEVVCIR
jgi:ribonuclease VapC